MSTALADPEDSGAWPHIEETAAQLAVKLRPMRPGDLAFITSTWLMSEMPWRGAHKETGARRAKRATMRTLIETQLVDARVLIACSKNHETANVGWACASGHRCLYAYVSNAFRGQGIGRALMREVIRE